ncbi:MAG: hypothetical protein LUO93_01695 [Methanomicrobiales archaeon]|nr:hypothetical protein [Methanomicrobiales archaeon]
MKILTVFVLIVFLAGIAGCIAPQNAGYLEGKVTIGPLCPVERPGQTCELTPETYAARKIVVTAETGTTVAIVDINATGYYRTALPPGSYIVDINHAGIDHSLDVPASVTILAGETIALNIDIDTGIR